LGKSQVLANAMMGISYSQLMIVLIVAVVLFGSRLPDVLRQVGKAYAHFRKGLQDFQFTLEDPNPTGYQQRQPARLTGPDNSGGKSANNRTAAGDSADDFDGAVDPGEVDDLRGAAPKFTPPPAELAQSSDQ